MKKFVERFRISEFATAMIAFGWAIALLRPSDTFASSYAYDTMRNLAQEYVWGIFSLLIGVFQMFGLFVSRPKLRMVSLLTATGFWSFVSAMFYISSVWSTATWIYPWIAFQTAYAYIKVYLDQKVGDCNG